MNISILTPTTFRSDNKLYSNYEYSNLFESHISDFMDMQDIMSDNIHEKGIPAELLDFEINYVDGCVEATMSFDSLLTADQIQVVENLWAGQMSDGWGECVEQQSLDSVFEDEQFPCDDCHGNGYIELDEDEGLCDEEICDNCDGSGDVVESVSYEVSAHFDIEGITTRVNNVTV